MPAGGGAISAEPDDVVARIARSVVAQRHAGPRVVALAGSVAVGKSTFAEHLRAALADLGAATAVVATDSFLLATAQLDERGLMMRK